MFLVNSRLGQFSATLSRSLTRSQITVPGYLFSRSYEVILPSSLARVISRTLVFSTNPPVAVYGTDNLISHSRSFSWQCGINIFLSVESPHHASVYNARADFPTRTTYTLKLSHPIDSMFILLRPSAVDNDIKPVQEYQPVIHRLRLSASS